MTEEQVPKSLCDERTANILHSVDETKALVKDVRKLLLGNGEPGLFEQVRDIRDWARKHEEAHATTARFVEWAITNGGMWKIVVALLTGLGILGGASVALFK